MRTFNAEAAVTVGDLAIGPVRSDVEGAGTLAEPDSDLKPAQFGIVIKGAIARAQLAPGNDPASPR